jgi:hypothetical protein
MQLQEQMATRFKAIRINFFFWYPISSASSLSTPFPGCFDLPLHHRMSASSFQSNIFLNFKAVRKIEHLPLIIPGRYLLIHFDWLARSTLNRKTSEMCFTVWHLQSHVLPLRLGRSPAPETREKE